MKSNFSNLLLSIVFCGVFSIILTGCGPSEEERLTAAKAAAENQVAPLRESFDAARTRGDWSLALNQAQAILSKAPDGAAAQYVNQYMEEIKDKAAADAEKRRLEGLWRYMMQVIEGHSTPQRTADINNSLEKNDQEQTSEEEKIDSFEPISQVRLVLRNDPRWGKSTFLIIDRGNFSCGSPCRFLITFDNGKPQRFEGRTASTGTAPALFINDDQRFVGQLSKAKQMSIAPANGKSTSLLFEIAGFDPKRWVAGR